MQDIRTCSAPQQRGKHTLRNGSKQHQRTFFA
ncbi:hypothetical protein DAMDJJ_18075 [Cupriavidus necator]